MRWTAAGGKRVSAARSAMKVELRATDGQLARKGQDVMHLSGKAGAILTGERTALEFSGAPERNSDADAAICGAIERDASEDSRHAKDDAGIAAIGKVRGEDGRRDESPVRAVRRDSTKRESHSAGGRRESGAGPGACVRVVADETTGNDRLRGGGIPCLRGRSQFPFRFR